MQSQRGSQESSEFNPGIVVLPFATHYFGISMFPIRCVVECVNEGECVKCSDHGTVVADSFAIVAGQTPLSQLVETVLTALGFQHLSLGAKAWIQLKNWKPLSFDKITDDPDVEIEYLLKDVSNQLTLRILTKQSDAAMLDCIRDMRDRLLKALLKKMPKLLQDAGKFHPQLKELISQIIQGDTGSALVDAEQMHQFNAWLEEFGSSTSTASSLCYPSNGTSYSSSNLPQNGLRSMTNPYSSTGCSDSNHGGRYPSSSQGSTHPSTPGATRFSLLLEVPKLERWFRENPNPSRQKLQYYMQILNGSNFRKHAGKITYQQICNWFSNARATIRKKDEDKPGHRSAESIQIDHPGSSSSSAIDVQRPNSSGSGMATGSGLNSSHWVSKVFSNNVRNLSIAFNDFIQSAPPKVTKNDGIVAVTVPNGIESPPPAFAGIVQQNSPSVETSSTSSQSPKSRNKAGSREVTVNVASEDIVPMEEDDDEEEPRMRVVEDGADELSPFSSSVSPSMPSISVGAVMKAALNEGLPTMAAANGRLPVVPTTGSYGHAASPSSSAANAGINRTRLMFDPLTELPMLERWFEENPHPSWAQVDLYTDQLNSLSYRQTYPPVSAHNLKIWFKNRRAKCKRLMNGTGANADGTMSAITIKSENI